MIGERFKILLDNNVIDQQTYHDTLKVHQEIILNNGYSSVDSVVFLTHLAMALQRVKKNETVAKVEDYIIDEIKNLTTYDKIVALTENTLKIVSIPLPQDEVHFLWMHLANIVEKGEQHD